MEYIQSKDNRTLKRMVGLEQRKNRDKYKEYMVEGVRSVRDLAERGQLKVIGIRESSLPHEAIQELIKLPSTEHIQRFLIQDPLFEKLDHTMNGQGVVGIAEKQVHNINNFKEQAGLYLMLDGIQDPGNLGTIIRTAVVAGTKAIFLTKGTVDVYNDKTIRSTMSALNEITIYEGLDADDVQYVLEEYGLTSYVTTLDGATDYSAIDYAPATLLVLGNEGNGVSQKILEACEHRITIPMYGNIESLNVSIASALCLYKVRESWSK